VEKKVKSLTVDKVIVSSQYLYLSYCYFKKNLKKTMPSGCKKNDNRMTLHPLHIGKKYKPDDHVIRLSFCFANDNPMAWSS